MNNHSINFGSASLSMTPPNSGCADTAFIDARMLLDKKEITEHDRPINEPPAMSYVPWQRWGHMYNGKTALERGTAFPVLDKPFLARRDGR